MNKKELAELYRILNLILTSKKRYLSIVSSVMTFKITDFLYLRNSGIDMFPSFKNDVDLTSWAKSNGFSFQFAKNHHVAYLHGVTDATASLFYVYCKRDYFSYRHTYREIILKILRNYYNTATDLISLLEDLVITLNDVVSHHMFNVKHIARFNLFIKAINNRISFLKNNLTIAPKDDDYSLCFEFIDIDHVKCKSSVAKNDWLLMLPCYPWVNRFMGRSVERRLKNKKLLLSGNFNYTELIKTLIYGVPQNKIELSTALKQVQSMYPDKQNSLSSVEVEMTALFKF